MTINNQGMAVPTAYLLDYLIPQLSHHPRVQYLQINILLVRGGHYIQAQLPVALRPP